MAISAGQLTSSKTLEEFRQEFNKLIQDVNDIKDNSLFTSDIKFEGSSDDDFETTLTVTNPTADRTITLPDETGTMVTTSSTINATTSTVSANNSADETVFPVFVDGATGSQGLESDTGLTYNPSSGILTATQFTGALSGNATTATALATGRTIGMTGDVTWTSASFDGSGNVTGTAAIGTGVIVNADVNASAAIAMSKTALVAGTGITLSTNTLNVDAAQSQITSVGTLTGLTIADAGNIGSASDTDAIAISSGGVVSFSATTANTNKSDGAVTVAGGLGVAGDVSIGDDLRLDSDAAVMSFGDDGDVTLTHVADTGLLLNGTMQLQFNDASQNINAPSATVLDINATDEIELNATLADINANLDVSGTYTGGGLMTTGGNIVIPNSGNIGSADDTDAIAISNTGVVTLSQRPVLSGGLTIADNAQIGTASDADAITLDATGVATFSQRPVIGTGGITIPNDGQIGSAGDTDAISINSSGNVTMSQDLTITGNLTVNGSTVTNSASNTVIEDYLIELNNGAGSNSNDIGIIMERGSTGDNAFMGWDESADKFVFGTTTATGASSGNLSISNGTIVAANVEGTLTTAAQTNITSVGTLSGLAIANGGNIGSASDTDAMSIASGGAVTFSQRDVHSAGITIADAGQIGSASDGDSMAIAADGVVTFTQIPVMSAGLNVSGGTITGTIATGAQTNITSVGALDGGSITSNFGTINTGSSTITTTGNITGGTLTSSGNVVIANAGNIGSAGDTDAIAIASDGVVTMNQIPVFSAGINVSGGGVKIADGGNIGSASDTDAIAIAADGKTTFSQQATFSNGIKFPDSGTIDTATTTALITLLDDSVRIQNASTDDGQAMLQLYSADSGSGSSPDMLFWRNSSSPADNDYIGKMIFMGENDASQSISYATQYAQILDVTDGTEDGRFVFSALSNGSYGYWTMGSTGSGTGTLGLTIPNGSYIGSGSDPDALSIASDGKISLTQDLYLTGSQKELRFYEGSNYVGFKAPSLSGNQIWSLPATDASSNGDALVSDGAGGLSFSSTVGSNATSVTLADESSDTSCFVMFATAATGNQNPKTGSNLTFNSDTGALTASSFVGNITGNVTGNVSGSAATVTGAAQSSITSLGTLTTLTVDNIIINGTNIGHTSDTDAIAIASDGKTTFSQQTIHSGGIKLADDGTIGSTSVTDALTFTAAGEAHFKDDVELVTDGKDLKFGVNSDVRLMHVHNSGLELKQSVTSNVGFTLTFNALDTAISADDKLGKIEFKAGAESSGSDAILPGAYISAVAEGTFSASNNATKIDFATGISETATPAMSLSSTGELTFPNKQGGDNILLDGTNAASANAGDDVTLNGTDGSSTNADSNIIFEDAVVLTTQTDRHLMKRMMGEFGEEMKSAFPNRMRLIDSTGATLRTLYCAGDSDGS